MMKKLTEQFRMAAATPALLVEILYLYLDAAKDKGTHSKPVQYLAKEAQRVMCKGRYWLVHNVLTKPENVQKLVVNGHGAALLKTMKTWPELATAALFLDNGILKAMSASAQVDGFFLFFKDYDSAIRRQIYRDTEALTLFCKVGYAKDVTTDLFTLSAENPNLLVPILSQPNNLKALLQAPKLRPFRKLLRRIPAQDQAVLLSAPQVLDILMSKDIVMRKFITTLMQSMPPALHDRIPDADKILNHTELSNNAPESLSGSITIIKPRRA